MKKETRESSFKSKYVISTSKPLELLHMDLFGSSMIKSFARNYYALVVVDDYFRYTWTDVVSIVCYVLNRMLIRPISKVTPYGIFKGRKLKIPHLRIFRSKCFVLSNGKENHGKFDSKADKAIFFG